MQRCGGFIQPVSHGSCLPMERDNTERRQVLSFVVMDYPDTTQNKENRNRWKIILLASERGRSQTLHLGQVCCCIVTYLRLMLRLLQFMEIILTGDEFEV